MKYGGFTLGVLAACCILLVIGLVITWKEVNELEHGPAAKRLLVTTSEFAAPGAGPGAGAVAGDLLSFAPANTIVVVMVDGAKLAETAGQAEQFQGIAMQQAPVDIKNVREMALFLSADPANADAPPIRSGFIKLSGDTSLISQMLSAMVSSDVEGMKAFKTAQGYTTLDGETMLLGETPEALGTMIRAYKGGGAAPPTDLSAALAQYSGSPVRIAAVLPASLRPKLVEMFGADAPPFAGDIGQAAAGLSFADAVLNVDAKFTLDKPESAQQAATWATEELKKLKEQLGAGAPGAPAALTEVIDDLLASLNVSATGQDVAVQVKVDVEKIRKAIAAMMMQGITGGAPAGAAPRPAAGGGAPAGGAIPGGIGLPAPH